MLSWLDEFMLMFYLNPPVVNRVYSNFRSNSTEKVRCHFPGLSEAESFIRKTTNMGGGAAGAAAELLADG